MSPPSSASIVDDAAIVLDRVAIRFDDEAILSELSLTVSSGTILGLIGPSGSGKTTTVRLLTGALAPTEGVVRVLGEDPQAFRRKTRERIGYMPQSFTLYPDLTARENVDFVASLYGLLYPRRRRRTKAVLTLVELWDVRGRRASRLSGGMQRRLELACALVHEPSLLFLDEPTAGLDPLLRGRVWEELHRLREAGRTILVTTQYLNEAEDCDQVALIAGGRMIAFGPPEALRRQAVGGDRVLIETEVPFDSRSLSSLPFVRMVNQVDERTMSVTVDDVGTAVPAVVDKLGQDGVVVVSTREDRPSFDDVFAALVQRDSDARAQTGDPTPSAEEAA